MLQKLAAIGSEIRNKKIVISLSPSFYYEGRYHIETYAGNFSPLQANALAFSTELSLEIKRAVARRMLDHPESLQKDQFLKFALERLADGSTSSLALYYAARAVLYARLRETVKAHDIPVVVLDDHDEDKYFLIDPGAHMSSKGWVFYDQQLDAFYHGTLR